MSWTTSRNGTALIFVAARTAQAITSSFQVPNSPRSVNQPSGMLVVSFLSHFQFARVKTYQMSDSQEHTLRRHGSTIFASSTTRHIEICPAVIVHPNSLMSSSHCIAIIRTREDEPNCQIVHLCLEVLTQMSIS